MGGVRVGTGSPAVEAGLWGWGWGAGEGTVADGDDVVLGCGVHGVVVVHVEG